MLELLFLLLPVAAGYGWFMGRNSILQEQRKHRKQFQNSYFKGLNYFLNNQPDKGVDELITTLTVSSETVETHFALAQLFRKRGQIDKALKVHQYLVEQAKLNKEDTGRAIFELAEDFVAAGMFDKAEEEYKRVFDDEAYRPQALKSLLGMYRITKEWKKGIEAAERFIENEQELAKVVANFYCELANQEPPKEKEALLRKALRIDPDSCRALMECADLILEDNDYREALEMYIHVVEQEPSLLMVCNDKIRQCCHTESAWQKYHDLIASVGSDNGNATAIINEAEQIAKEKTLSDAVAFLIESLRKKPNVKVFAHLMDMQQEHGAQFDSEQLHQTISEMLQDFLKTTSPYNCNDCGHKTRYYHWQCPRCHHWETIRPHQGLTGE